MILRDIIKGFGRAEAYDLYMWMLFLSQKPPCKDCVETFKSKGRVPDCNKCIPSSKLVTRAQTLLEEKELKQHGKKT